MSSFDPGGTERQMIELARRLDPARWTIHIACFRARGGWFDRAAEAARSVAEFPVKSFKSRDLARHMHAFARWARGQRIAVIHTIDLPSNIFGLPAAAFARVPVRIANRREINPGRSAAELALQRAAYTCAHRIVANSRAAADRLRMERIPDRKIAIIPNGLEVARFIPQAARVNRRRVVVVANLRPEKGHDVLVDAAPAILQRFPEARFELIGGGPGRAFIASRAAERGVAHAFTFAGHCEDVAARLGAADIFVLPTRSDASPNAVVEAMAAGLPIIASDVGGIGELVEDECTGLLVPPDDPPALADRICRLMTDDALGARLGAAARRRAETRHSFDRMVAAFEAIYVAELDRAAMPIERDRFSRAMERDAVARATEHQAFSRSIDPARPEVG
jgi:L-malate glycosyltransferase